MSADWKSKVGANTAVEWPVGIGAKGNEGVANNVSQTKGSIGYVEYAYAKQNKLTNTKLINKDGKTVAPTGEVVHGGGGERQLGSHAGLRRRADRRAGCESWPLAGATFILMHKQAAGRRAPSKEALKFFDWAYGKGDKMAEELDYVPMPDNVVASIKRYWANEIKDNGRQADPALIELTTRTEKAPVIGAFSTFHRLSRA